jgi:sec-independent protein translocase protein TatA
MVTTVPLQIPGVPGGPELLIILLIAVLLFGANKIPKLARSSGEAIGEFQKGRQEVEDELQDMKEGGSDSSDEEGEDTLDLEEESTSSTSSSGS